MTPEHFDENTEIMEQINALCREKAHLFSLLDPQNPEYDFWAEESLRQRLAAITLELRELELRRKEVRRPGIGDHNLDEKGVPKSNYLAQGYLIIRGHSSMFDE